MRGRAIQVTATATQVIPEGGATVRAGEGAIGYPTAGLIRFPTGMAQTVYLGGPDVDTSTNGVPFVAGEDVEIDLVGDILYGVVATTSVTIYVLRRG